MSQISESIQSRQTSFLPSAERFGPTVNQTFAHHVETLRKLEEPISNIYLSLSTELPVSSRIETFNASANQINLWLESANIAIFALELDVKEGLQVKSVGEMDVLIHKFAPNIELLQELLQAILIKLTNSDDDEKNRKEIQNSYDRINSDWLDVKSFFGKVKKEMSESKQRRELLDTMNQIINSIDELNTSIFEYQEQRLSESNYDSYSSSPSTRGRQGILSNGTNNEHNSNNSSSRADNLIRQLDSRLEPLDARLVYLRSRLSATNAPSDPKGELKRKNKVMTEKWDELKHEMEILRKEVKEDKWLNGFKQIFSEVNQMMDKLEKVVKQCKDYIKIQKENRGMSRYNQRAFSRDLNPKNLSSKPYKIFENKRKYYIPAIDKMLTNLANDINKQNLEDYEVIKKYKYMKERWTILLESITDIDHDVSELEGFYDHSPHSPHSSHMTNYSPPSSIASSIASSPPLSPNLRPTTRDMYSLESGSPPPKVHRSSSRSSPYRIMSPEYHEPSLSPPRNNARSPSVRSKSPSPRAISPPRNYLTPNNRHAESPPHHYERQHWNSHSQYNNGSSYNTSHSSHYNQPYNNNNQSYNQPYDNYNHHSYNREHGASPQPRKGRPSSRPDSPTRSLDLTMTPSSASSIPRPVTSMGIVNRTSSRAGMRSLLPKPSTPQPSMYRNGMGSPTPPPIRRPLVRSPTPSSQTSGPSRPITPEHDDSLSQALASFGLTKTEDNKNKIKYIPLRNDPIDVEVANVVNRSSTTIRIERVPGNTGRYYIGNADLGRDRKVYNIKLAPGKKKPMIRVGSGWTQLDWYLFDQNAMSLIS
ncbi:10551_t:CDS:1 [Diversispora eburnea]|uniref:10551_t:CDS:1 n=1 Tax=Diversispora eburnea TaxID=1213867 RepID=A0A9N9BX33_9GLOM|nr:10551_t:CDS:1 [Diversispora eburnea]